MEVRRDSDRKIYCMAKIVAANSIYKNPKKDAKEAARRLQKFGLVTNRDLNELAVAYDALVEAKYIKKETV